MYNYLEDNGVLVHCISGWDRTPLYISIIRLSLWAVSDYWYEYYIGGLAVTIPHYQLLFCLSILPLDVLSWRLSLYHGGWVGQLLWEKYWHWAWGQGGNKIRSIIVQAWVVIMSYCVNW